MTGKLEGLMGPMGRDRYRSQQAAARECGYETRTAAGHTILRKASEEFYIELINYLEGVRSNSTAGLYLKLIEPRAVANIVCRYVLNRIGQRARVSSVAGGLGRLMQDEFNLEKLKRSPQFWETFNTLKSHTLVWKRRARLLEEGKFKWNARSRGHTGTVCLLLFQESTGLVELVVDHTESVGRRHPPRVLLPSQHCIDELARTNEAYEGRAMMWLPMDQEPVPWKGPLNGGYRGVRGRPLVNPAKHDRHNRKALREATMPEVYKAVNALQASGWELNSQVVDFAREARASGAIVPGMPGMHLLEPPPYPAYGSSRSEIVASKRAYAAYCNSLAVAEAEYIRCSMILYKTRLYAAKKLWFPVFMDFRGRIYTVGEDLRAQGSDMARAMLRFADGKAIGGNSSWLAVYGANCWGLGRDSFSERQAAIEKMTPTIKSIAADPFANRTWHDASKPWQFLAFCFEWAAFKKEGPLFVTKLPCYIDGTANFFQITSLLMRDPILAKLSNCSNGTRPEDIYTRIADGVTRALKLSTDPLDREWLDLCGGKVDRSVVKPSIIRLAFASSHWAIGEATAGWLQTYVRENGMANQPFSGAVAQPCNQFACHVRRAADPYLGSFEVLRDAVRAVRRNCGTKKKHVIWNTPMGFPVRQIYRPGRSFSIRSKVNQKALSVNFIEYLPGVDGPKASRAMLANFVQSLDACALMAATNLASDAGIKSFSPIHDCMGVLAPDVGAMHRAVRQGYVDVFKTDPLEDFFRQVGGETTLPERGDFDISEVLKSAYFFS